MGKAGVGDLGASSFGQGIRDVASEVRAHPELTLGFALLWAWTRLSFGTSAFDGTPLFAYEFEPDAEAMLVLANALTYLAIGALFKLKGMVPSGTPYLAFVTIALSMGAALCSASAHEAFPLQGMLGEICLTGAVFVGIGVAFVYVEWGRILGHLGPRRALAHTCCGVLGSAAILVALEVLPVEVQGCYLVLAPLAIMGIVFSYMRRTSSKAIRHGIETDFRIPWRLLGTAAVIGVAFGVGFGADGLGNYLAFPLERNALTFAVVAVMLVLSAILFKMDFNQLIYRFGMPLVAAGCLIYALFGNLRELGGFVFSAGYLFLDLLLWILLAHIIKHQDISANWIVALETGCLLLGRSTGSFVASILEGAANETLSHGEIFVIVAYALMLCALLMVNKRNILVGWGSTRPASREVGGSLGLACRILGGDYGLTPRETEVLSLLARGYSRETISNTLTLSKETVRTHVANVFRKLGVHSHQELIMLAEERVKALADQ